MKRTFVFGTLSFSEDIESDSMRRIFCFFGLA